jgi:transcription termination factor Rho
MYNENSVDTVTEKLIALMTKTKGNEEFLEMFTKLDVLSKDNGKEKWER